MTPVRVAYPELRRTAREALRGAGLPLAQADEAADMLVWTEAASGGGLAFVRSGALAKPVRPRLSDEGTLVDCGGASLLAVGLRIADYALAAAQQGQPLRLAVHDTTGAEFLPYTARHAARLGCSVIAAYADVGGGGALSLLVEAQSGDRPRLAVWRDGDHAPSPADGRVTFVCGRAPISVLRRHGRVPDPPPDVPADIAWDARAADALARGLDVASEDYAAFTACSSLLRVPTSERSRAQAG
jgi:hypothetical protein